MFPPVLHKIILYNRLLYRYIIGRIITSEENEINTANSLKCPETDTFVIKFFFFHVAGTQKIKYNELL